MRESECRTPTTLKAKPLSCSSSTTAGLKEQESACMVRQNLSVTFSLLIKTTRRVFSPVKTFSVQGRKQLARPRGRTKSVIVDTCACGNVRFALDCSEICPSIRYQPLESVHLSQVCPVSCYSRRRGSLARGNKRRAVAWETTRQEPCWATVRRPVPIILRRSQSLLVLNFHLIVCAFCFDRSPHTSSSTCMSYGRISELDIEHGPRSPRRTPASSTAAS